MKKRTEQDLEYFDTFILVSPDTKAVAGFQPEGETVAAREYRMIGPNSFKSRWIAKAFWSRIKIDLTLWLSFFPSHAHA